MNIRAEYLVGKQKDSEWAGVYGYRPENESPDKATEMFTVVRIETEAEAKNLERISKMLLDELQECYFDDNQAEDGILRIENAFNKMKAKLEMILSREEEIMEKGIDLEIGAAFLVEGTLYLGVVGESKVYIYRNKKLVDISGALVDGNMSGFIKTGSLKVNDTDVFCLATSNVAEDYESLKVGVETLNIDRMSLLKEREGAALLMFGDQNLEWNQKDETPQLAPNAAPLESDSVIAENLELNEPASELIEDTMQSSIESQPTVGRDHIDETVFTDESIGEDDYDPLENSAIPIPIESGEASVTPVKNTLGSLLNRVKSRAQSISGRSSEQSVANNRYKNEQIVPSTNAGSNIGGVIGGLKTKASNVLNRNSQNSEDTAQEKTYVKIFHDILNFIRKIIAGLVNLFKREILGRGVDRTNIIAYQNKIQRNRRILVVVLIIAIIFIYMGIRDAQGKRIDAERIETIKTELVNLQNEFTQLNSQVETVKTQDQSKKDLLVTRIGEITKKAESGKKEGVFVNDFESLIDQSSLAKDNLLLIKEVNSANLQLISDIGKVHADAQPNDIAYTSGNIFVSDFKRGVIYKILPSTGSDPSEFAENLTNPSSITKNAAGDIIFYDANTSTSIGRVSPTSGEVRRFPFLSTAVAGTSKKAATYSGNDALYEIHQDHQQIFKREKQGPDYAGGGAIYSEANPPNWKTDPEFAKAIDIAVPYELYVLIQDGGLRRYLAGGENGLTFETFTNFSRNDYDSLNKATAFDIDMSTMAVADPKNQRVLIFEIQPDEQKLLKFTKQFVYRGGEDVFKNIKEVAISESSSSVFVLDGTKVVKLNL